MRSMALQHASAWRLKLPFGLVIVDLTCFLGPIFRQIVQLAANFPANLLPADNPQHRIAQCSNPSTVPSFFPSINPSNPRNPRSNAPPPALPLHPSQPLTPFSQKSPSRAFFLSIRPDFQTYKMRCTLAHARISY